MREISWQFRWRENFVWNAESLRIQDSRRASYLCAKKSKEIMGNN